MKKRIIWSNLDYNIEDWRDGYKEYLEINDFDDDPDDEEAIYDWMVETNNLYLDDVHANLNIKTDGRILVIADLGRWNGRKQGYRILGANVNDILFAGYDYIEWYDDGHNIRAIGYHHDGTDYLEFREIREDRDVDRLLEAIYNGDEISRQKMNYYTKSLHKYAKKVYGW